VRACLAEPGLSKVKLGQRVEVRVDVDDPVGLLKIGMPADVVISPAAAT
jgi:hypothetical protein